MVYFRLSEEEFQQLNRLCETEGARSLSDLARLAVQEMIERGAHSVQLEMVEKLRQLDETIGQLARRLDNFAPAGNPPPNGRTIGADDNETE